MKNQNTSRLKYKIKKSNDNFYKSRKNSLQSWCKRCKRESKRCKGSVMGYLDSIPFIDGYLYCKACNNHKKINFDNFQKSRLDRLTGANNKFCECKKCRNKTASNYQASNKERRRANHKNWRDKNRGRVRKYNKSRKLSILTATPSWHESELIIKVYEKAVLFNMEVDHIVPINSNLVCGLHCWDNLQLLLKYENGSKSNLHWPDMP